MKRFYCACVFLIGLVILCLMLTLAMKRQTEFLQEGVQEVFDFAEQGEIEHAGLALYTLNEGWKQNDFLFHLISGREHCEKVESVIVRAEVSIKSKNSSELLLAVAELSDILASLYEMQKPKVKTLF